jgi:RsiW-degrading membrane proteinase PrsW (M82 family)
MFYYLVEPGLTWNLVLIAAAVIPAVFLMVKVYQSDRLEKESRQLMWQLVKAGILSSLLAMVAERILSYVLDETVAQSSAAYDVLLYFIVVAVSEECCKYLMLKRNTWRSPEFNCMFDGVVYAVFVSLGFGLWENISYVLTYGLSTAIVRAVTAIPGHACFGVFMGVFYAISKKYEVEGMASDSRTYRVLSVLVPVLLHGAYDYIASTYTSGWYFVIFVAALFAVSFRLVSQKSKTDRYI